MIAWTVAALLGTVAVLWLRSYLEGLATLAETDRDTALQLFRTRAIPALLGVVAIAVGAGAILMRMGLQIVNAPKERKGFERKPEEDAAGAGVTPPTIGWAIAGAGFMLAAVPLALLSVMFWMLR